ncbi:MAG: ABC transporter substrate-binding protein [Bacteroidetes bacterium]|nr:ABC transporter substrate-binding protein [Bacteroidota bacterium]
MIFKTIFNCLIDFNRFCLFIHIILVLTFCSCNESNNIEKSKVFRYNSENGITSLDPAFARTQDNIWAVSQLFNGLVQLDKNLNILPCIARRWEISADGLKYTFYLRNDVLFHKSDVFKNKKQRKVVASDFVFSFNRIIDEKTASPGSWIFNDKIASNPFVALNDTIFIINLKKAFPPFLGLLTMPYCFAVPSEAIKKHGKDFGRNPVGTGPFVFGKWNEEVKLIFLKNEEYFETDNGVQLPFIDAVAVSFLDDKQTAFLEFLQGNLSFFNGVESSFKDEIINKDGSLKSKYKTKFKSLKTPFLNTEYIAFLVDDSLENSKNHPLYDKNLRLAINYAIDKKSLIKYLRNNIGTPANGGFVPIGLAGHYKNENFVFDIKKSKFYLEKSKWFKTKKPVTLYTTKDYLDICLFIQKDLRKAGIDIKIEVQPASFLKEEKSNNRLNFFRGSWIADYPDAENYLACFYSPNYSPQGPNYTHFKNLKFDQLYDSVFKAANENDRVEIYHRMENILMNECPVIPLFYDQSLRLINNNVKNLDNNPTNSLDLKRVKIE